MLKHYFYILLSFIALSGYLLAMEEQNLPSRDELTHILFGSDSEDDGHEDTNHPINLHVKHILRASKERAQIEHQTLFLMSDLMAFKPTILDEPLYDLTNYPHDIIEKYFAYKLLKNESMDLNQQDNQGRTILIKAIEEGKTSILKLLIEQGTSVNLADHQGRTPAYLAVDNNNQPLLDYLAHQGADVNISDVQGQTPLYLAITKIYPTMVECLTEHTVDVNKKIKETTPLHLAIQAFINCTDQDKKQRLYYIIQSLINAHADLTAKDNNNKTPLTLVIETQNFELAELFRPTLAQNNPFQN